MIVITMNIIFSSFRRCLVAVRFAVSSDLSKMVGVRQQTPTTRIFWGFIRMFLAVCAYPFLVSVAIRSFVVSAFVSPETSSLERGTGSHHHFHRSRLPCSGTTTPPSRTNCAKSRLFLFNFFADEEKVEEPSKLDNAQQEALSEMKLKVDRAEAESRIGKAGSDDDGDDDDDDILTHDVDGYYLDPDLYAQSRKLLNPDGSLRLDSLMTDDSLQDVREDPQPQEPFSEDDFALDSTVVGTLPTENAEYRQLMERLAQPNPASFEDLRDSTAEAASDDDATMDDLWAVIRENRPAMDAAAEMSMADTFTYDDSSSKEDSSTVDGKDDPLYDQVFAGEDQDYSQQNSKVFRDALMADNKEKTAKAAEARSLRNGKAFRARQQAALDSLQQQIDDFEQNILPQLKPDQDTSAKSNANEVPVEKSTTSKPEQRLRCSQCGAILGRDEIDHWIRQVRTHKKERQQELLKTKAVAASDKAEERKFRAEMVQKRICRACHCDNLVTQSSTRQRSSSSFDLRTSSSFSSSRNNSNATRRRMSAPAASRSSASSLRRKQTQPSRNTVKSSRRTPQEGSDE